MRFRKLCSMKKKTSIFFTKFISTEIYICNDYHCQKIKNIKYDIQFNMQRNILKILHIVYLCSTVNVCWRPMEHAWSIFPHFLTYPFTYIVKYEITVSTGMLIVESLRFFALIISWSISKYYWWSTNPKYLLPMDI